MFFPCCLQTTCWCLLHYQWVSFKEIGKVYRAAEVPGGSASLLAVRETAYVKQFSLWINLIFLFFSDNCHWKVKSKTDIRDFLAGWQQGSERDFAGREHSICALRFLNDRIPIRFRSLHLASGSGAIF